MQICISSQGDNLEAQVDPRFGRCQYFIVVDTETFEFEAIQNPNVAAMGGAGIQSAQLVANKGIKAVLTGNTGPNAFQTLQAAGLEVIAGVSGVVREAIEKYKKGELKSTEAPSVASKFGMGGGRGMGLGRGMGTDPAPQTEAPSANKNEELKGLKNQAEDLKQQIEETNKKIDELSKE